VGLAESVCGGTEAQRSTTNDQSESRRRPNEVALGGARGEKVFFFLLRERGRAYPTPGKLIVGENRLLFGNPKRKEVFPSI